MMKPSSLALLAVAVAQGMSGLGAAAQNFNSDSVGLEPWTSLAHKVILSCQQIIDVLERVLPKVHVNIFHPFYR